MRYGDAAEAWVKFYPPITGSKLRRAWCNRCGEPIRISVEEAKKSALRIEDRGSRPLCRACDPVLTLDKYFSLTERQRVCLGRTRS
jgi:hypothetical protein